MSIDTDTANARGAGLIDRAIGERIRERRLKAGMSQEALAGLLGVTFQQVQKYERGTNRVALSRACAVARHLKCELADLVPPAALKAAAGRAKAVTT